MRVLILLVAAVAVCSARYHSRHVRHRREVASPKDLIKGIMDKFPTNEWNSFWKELTSAVGDQREELTKKLAEHEGDMGQTLDEFREKLADKYPQIKDKWEVVQNKWKDFQKLLQETTLMDLRNMAYEKITGLTGDMDASTISEYFESAKAKFMALYETYKGTY